MDTIKIKTRDTYNVYTGRGILKDLPELLKKTSYEIDPEGSLIFIVTDRNVSRCYLKGVTGSLKKSGFKVKSSIFRPGEGLKSCRNLYKMLRIMVKQGLTRDSVIIGLGGGVIGDFSGFAASIYMRGCHFIQVPTTLLAQVDSSIGGKVGINMKEGKNLIGSFYNPLFVLSDTDTLKTLNGREITCGLAEIIKYGLIFNKDLFEKTTKFFNDYTRNSKTITAKDLKELVLNDTEFLHEMIHKSVRIKGEIVRADERENDLRMILNFGHTFGHAVEKLTRYRKFLHGEAVMLGMKMAVELSSACGFKDAEEKRAVTGLIDIFEIPSVRGLTAKAIYSQIGSDKKKRRGKIHYIVLKKIGYAVSETEIEKKTVVDCIGKVLSGY